METEVKKMTGTICWFNISKSFGWIAVENRRDLYFQGKHLLNVTSVATGDPVEFEVSKNTHGDCAVNVKLINPV